VTVVIRGLRGVVDGERLLAVVPTLAPNVPGAAWGKRANMFVGRAVSHLALIGDQDHHAGHLAVTAQRMAPGVVSGLAASLELATGGPILHVAPGVGVDAFGEDVRVARPLTVTVYDLELPELVPGGTRRRLGSVIGDGQPHAFAVVLEPITAMAAGRGDPDSPCERDPSDVAFEDDQLIDGCRITVLPLDAALLAGLPAATWRNELAYRIFDVEAGLAAGTVAPWQAAGVALGLLGFPPAAGAPFLDLGALVRDGGQLARRRPLPGQRGTVELWQARFQQFIGHIRETDIEALRSAGLASHFRYLPPVGLLPPGLVDVRGDRGEPDQPLPSDAVLPGSFAVEAVPVELETLDDVLRASAALAPFDTGAAEQMRLVVPIPQRYFDPDLLIVEDETPDEFIEARYLFLLRLNHRLGRRRWVRRSDRDLARYVEGTDRTYPVDPDAVDGELSSDFPPDLDLPPGEPVPPPELPYAEGLVPALENVARQVVDAVGGTETDAYMASLVRSIYAELKGPGFPGGTMGKGDLVAAFLSFDFGGKGVAGFVDALSRRLIRAAEVLDTTFLRLEAELHRVRTLVADEDAATTAATSPVLASFVRRSRVRPQPLQLAAFRRNILRDGQVAVPAPVANPVDILTAGVATGGRTPPSAFVFGATILDRLRSTVAVDALEGARRAKIAAFKNLIEVDATGLSFAGLTFPGFMTGADGNRVYTLQTLPAIAALLAAHDDGAPWVHDPVPGSATEAAFFEAAIRCLEHTIAAVRVAEARLTGYETAQNLLRDQLGDMLEMWRAVEARLAALQDEIGEMRHDVRVTAVLEQEEIARARTTNQRRRQLIAEHVPFVVFTQARTARAIQHTPAATILPADMDDVVPACVAADFEAPEYLRAMVDLLREAPIGWLTVGPPLVGNVNRWWAMWQVWETAYHRALSPSPVVYNPFESPTFEDRTGRRARAIFAAQASAIGDRRKEASAQFRDDFRYYPWTRLREVVERFATVNDLLTSAHGRHDVAMKVADELGNVYRVIACLYERLRVVPPFLRLQWVEGLSEAEGPVDLRELSILADWQHVDRRDRRELQAVVDWLYGRVVASNAAAVQYVHDLLRVAFMLSSHPVVNGVIAVDVVRPAAVAAGALVTVAADAGAVRVGMHALLYESRGAAPAAARGLVVDVGDRVASVQIIGTDGKRTVTAVRAELSEPARNPRLALAAGGSASIDVASSFG
jgi:hypothetical protein